MSEASKTMIHREIETLVARLQRGEITEEEFQRQIGEAVESATTKAQSSTEHTVAQDQIAASSKRAKRL